MKKARQSKLRLFMTVMVIGLCAVPLAAQTTAFTYQGKLTDVGTPASGTYDMQFKLFDTAAVGTGTQQGATVINQTVQVVAGNFIMNLDFGTSVFTGAARFLEISVRPAGSANPYTTLAPRQPITASPYAIQTVNATQLGGLPASRYVAADGNGNVGIGTASPVTKLELVDPVRQLRFGPTTADNGGYLVSTNPSQAITAGGARWDGTNWIARGTEASLTANQDGVIEFFTNSNLSVGSPFNPTLRMHIDANGNVGIGAATPASKLEIAAQDGLRITGFNPFITLRDTSAARNSYVQGINGDLVFIPHSFSPCCSAMVIKDGSGNVGIGTTAPEQTLHVHGNTILSSGSAAGFTFRNRGSSGPADDWVLYSQGNIARLFRQNVGDVLAVTATGNVGIGTVNPTAKLDVNGNTVFKGNILVDGPIFFTAYAGIGGTVLCYNESSNGLVQCSSSLRYKTDIRPFLGGLNLVNRLRPITYKWKMDGTPDVGFGAEDVAEIEPLLITRNRQGEIQGVKYERLGVVFVNAFKEQQAQIEQQSRQVEKQQAQIKQLELEVDELRQAVKALTSSVRKARRK